MVVPCGDLCNGTRNSISGGEIRRDAKHCHTMRRQPFLGPLEGSGVPGTDRDRGALPHELLGGREADTPASATDQHDFAAKSEVHATSAPAGNHQSWPANPRAAA